MELSNNTHPQWWKDPGLRKLNFVLLTCHIGLIANGYMSSLVSNLMANPRWFADLAGLSNAKLLGLVVAAQPIGCIAAFFPAPWLSDKYGRRAGIVFGNICLASAFIAQILCKSFGQFLAARCLGGFGTIFNVVASSALLTELSHPRQRAISGAFLNTNWFLGAMSAAWISYGSLRFPNSWSWRLPILAQLFWTALQLALLCFCPESPRWLAEHGKLDKAKKILATYHANGYVQDEMVLSELSHFSLSTGAEDQERRASWSALYTTPGNRKRLILSAVIGIATQWAGNGVVTFYLAPVLRTVGVTSPSKQQGINGGLQIYNWFLACGAALLAERAGRRRLFLTSAGTMLLFMSLVTICSALYSTFQSAAAGYAVIAFLFLFLGGYVIGLTPIPMLYINEIWSSHLRAKGISVFWVTGSVASCFNLYVNPIALEKITWKYYLVYVGVLVGIIFFMFFYVPETKGLSLEEITTIFDRRQSDETALCPVERGEVQRVV
jgi:sugar porter (SP) family MFS transporter